MLGVNLINHFNFMTLTHKANTQTIVSNHTVELIRLNELGTILLSLTFDILVWKAGSEKGSEKKHLKFSVVLSWWEGGNFAVYLKFTKMLLLNAFDNIQASIIIYLHWCCF